MRKIKTFVGTFLVGIVLCGVLAVACFFIGVMPMIKNNNIIKNGDEAVATITDLIESNTAVNNKQTYHVEVEFVNKDGETVIGKSLDYLSLEDSQDIYDRVVYDGEIVTMTIRYIGKDIVVGTTALSITGISNIALTAASVITGLIALFLIAMLIKAVLTASTLNKLLLSGEPINAEFIETGKSMTMGKTKYFSITYKFTNSLGEIETVKSPKNYTQSDADTLKKVKSFPVNTSGKKSVIAYDFDNVI